MYGNFDNKIQYNSINIPSLLYTIIWEICLTFRNHESYIGQTYRYSPECSFYIFSQQIYLIIFLDFLSPSSFIPPQNVVCFLMLPFLVHKIFTFYVNGVLNCKVQLQGQRVNVVTSWCAPVSCFVTNLLRADCEMPKNVLGFESDFRETGKICFQPM